MVKNILEIGHGGIPIMCSPRNFVKRLPAHVEYFGIDRMRTYASQFREHEEFNSRIRELRKFVEDTRPRRFRLYDEDFHTADFVPDHFDEVHMHFVISDPSLLPHMPETIIERAIKTLNFGCPVILTFDGPREFFEMVLSELGVEVYSGKRAFDLLKTTEFGGLVREAFDLRMAQGQIWPFYEQHLLIGVKPFLH